MILVPILTLQPLVSTLDLQTTIKTLQNLKVFYQRLPLNPVSLQLLKPGSNLTNLDPTLISPIILFSQTLDQNTRVHDN